MSKIVTLNNLGKKPRIYTPEGGTFAESLQPFHADSSAFISGKRPIKLLVGMLMPDTTIDFSVMSCVEGLLNAMAGLRYEDSTYGYKVNFKQIRTSNIFAGRNELCDYAVRTGADYILFVDSDMVFPADACHQLICHGKDIASALAFKKAPPYDNVMGIKVDPDEDFSRVFPLRNWVDGAMIKVDTVGTAFMLIKTEILKDIPKPWFFHQDMGNNSVLGSDNYFCQKAGKSGFEVWVDTSIKIGHIGPKAYGFEDYIAHGGQVKPQSETEDTSTEFEYGPKKEEVKENDRRAVS